MGDDATLVWKRGKCAVARAPVRVPAIAVLLATSGLLSGSWFGLGLAALSCGEAKAEEVPTIRVAEAGASQLPALTVDQPTARVQRRRVEVRHRENTTA